MANDGRGAALLEPRRTLFHAVRRRLRHRHRQHLPGGRPLPGDVPVPVRRDHAAAPGASARAARQPLARRPDRRARRRHARGGGRPATDRRTHPRRRRFGGGLAGLSDRRPAAADLHDRRARHHRLAPGARVALDRREHAPERDRRHDLPLPDRHEHLSRGQLGRSHVARRGSAPGDGRLDAVATAEAPAGGGLAAGDGARRSRCSRRWECSSTETSTTSSRCRR